MNLLDAIKTGRRFRRPYMACENPEVYRWIENNNNDNWVYSIKADDILADDWEVEPEPRRKLKAWHGQYSKGGSTFAVFNESDTEAPGLPMSVYTRAPWLDEP